jgi:hypothetical protein
VVTTGVVPYTDPIGAKDRNLTRRRDVPQPRDECLSVV